MKLVDYIRWLFSPSVFPEESLKQLEQKNQSLGFGVITQEDYLRMCQETNLMIEYMLQRCIL